MNRTLSDYEIEAQAQRHEMARESARQIDPVTAEHPEMTIEDAYAIQKAWLNLELSRGAELVGHKIGLTSRAMQMSMNIDEPDFGYLLDYMFHESGCLLVASTYCDPKIEVELAFIIGDRLSGEHVTTDEVMACLLYTSPSPRDS